MNTCFIVLLIGAGWLCLNRVKSVKCQLQRLDNPQSTDQLAEALEVSGADACNQANPLVESLWFPMDPDQERARIKRGYYLANALMTVCFSTAFIFYILEIFALTCGK